MIEISLRGLFDTFRAFTRDIGQVEKLWNTFDNLPPMVGYSTGSTFSPQAKNIEIKNISYGYNDIKVFDDFSLMIKR